jgi:hypothetical protein
LRELADLGLRIVYSDETVPPRLTVASEPTARSGSALLEQLLAPHRLTAREVGPGVFAVVALPAVAADGSTVETTQPATSRPLEQIIVASSRYSLRESSPTVVTFLTQAEVEALPRFAEDSLKIVQRLPGAATNGVDGLGHMRGGEENETLVVFDGLPLYEPFHLRLLQSPMSVLDPPRRRRSRRARRRVQRRVRRPHEHGRRNAIDPARGRPPLRARHQPVSHQRPRHAPLRRRARRLADCRAPQQPR